MADGPSAQILPSQLVMIANFLIDCGASSLIGLERLGIAEKRDQPAAFLTLRRNRDYRSEVDIWSDTVAKHAVNPWAHFNLGLLYLDADPYPEGQGEMDRLKRLQRAKLDALLETLDFQAAASKFGSRWILEEITQNRTPPPSYKPA